MILFPGFLCTIAVVLLSDSMIFRMVTLWLVSCLILEENQYSDSICRTTSSVGIVQRIPDASHHWCDCKLHWKRCYDDTIFPRISSSGQHPLLVCGSSQSRMGARGFYYLHSG